MKHPISFVVALAIHQDMNIFIEFPELKVISPEDAAHFIEGYVKGIQERLVNIIESECAELLIERDGRKLYGFLRGRGVGLLCLRIMCETMVGLATGRLDPDKIVDMERIQAPTIFDALQKMKPFI